MPSAKGMELSFNQIPEQYDRCRPVYVDRLYRDIFAAKKLNCSSRVLEIGIGTGQATLPILKTGCFLTAVELGSQLAEYAEQKFSKYPKFELKNTAFQEYEGKPETFDLIFSATAFHWIPEEIGYPKVYELLKSGGVFARFANRPYGDKSRPELYQAIQEIYSVYLPNTVFRNREFGEADARAYIEIAGRYGFVDRSFRLYRRTRDFTAEEYTALLGTYSDHLAIGESRRKKFFAEIRSVIEDAGGIITIYDTIDLELARKP